jgi:hypothetical protein
VRCDRPEGAVTETGVPSPARRLYPKAGPVILRAADGTRLNTEVFGHEDSYPIAGLPVEVCILHQMNQPQPQSLSGVVTSFW